MKIGDILVCLDTTGYDDNSYKPYTKNKHYIIFKIDDDFVPGYICGYIKDDQGNSSYFKENEATNSHWEYLKNIRKEKLLKIQNSAK